MTKTKDTLIRNRDKRKQKATIRIDIIFLLSLIILSIAIGYSWRMHHEHRAIETELTTLNDHLSLFMPEQKH